MKTYQLCKQLFGTAVPVVSSNNLDMLMKMYREMRGVHEGGDQDQERSPRPSPFPEGEHFSAMIPSEIQQDIRKKMPISVQYQHSFTLPSGRTVNICLWFPSSSSTSKRGHCHIQDTIRCIYTWFAFLDAHVTTKTCSRELTIYLYMTDFTKKLPKEETNPELSEIHVNSAFTFSCKEHDASTMFHALSPKPTGLRPSVLGSNVIYIFRKEEWLKVLVHESIHALGVDFSWYDEPNGQSTAEILKVFHGVHAQRLQVFEAFTETWAELCVILLQICIITTTKHVSYQEKDVELILQNCLYYEQGWARIQCIKVLRYHGLTYQELFLKESDYHETKTAVFSYYVLKCVLMHHVDAFLTWSMQVSRGRGFTHIFTLSDSEYKKNIASFCTFLVKWAQDPAYRAMMHRLEEDTQRISLGDELRMSLWGGEV